MPALRPDCRTRWYRAALPTLAGVEDLLDQLEEAGCAERRVSVAEDQFVVRWRSGGDR